MESDKQMRVIFTLGPSSEDDETILAFLERADGFRLNASHLGPNTLRRWLERLEGLFKRCGRVVPIVVDLQGAKMRIGSLPSVESLPGWVDIILSEESSDEARLIPVPHERLFSAVERSERLSLNDGRVELQVEHVSDRRIRARVIRNGPLSSFKGINRPEHPVMCKSLSWRDRAAIECSNQFSFTRFAFSFVTDGTEAALLKEMTTRKIIAKIERPLALLNLGVIEENFDELWFCRGDLGAQAGIAVLGALQEQFESKLRGMGKPSLLAGQVLHHMTYFPRPTRSEVVHLSQVCRAGWSGIVLSDETAIGKHPLKVLAVVQKLLPASTEGNYCN